MKATFFYLALIATSLMLVAQSEAKIHTIDLKTAMGIWLLDENTGTEAKDISVTIITAKSKALSGSKANLAPP